MTIWLALDIGDKRIGLAAGSDEARLARPLRVITRSSKERDFEAIAQAVKEVGAEALLVGLPLNMDGSEGPQAKRVRKFAERLHRRLHIPLRYHDERLSSFVADQILAEKPRKKARRQPNDAVAAAAILQSFFDAGVVASSIPEH
ncbi:MAG TPA: Holliday junction resolvase RuvX [Anaerolineae bacterium]|nr:Holliday junction resolvase RuvX [Anaerolineae bacterium]